MSQTYVDRALGLRLRVARIVLGITVEEAARASGRSPITWDKYERTGRMDSSSIWIRKFATAFEVSLGWLLEGDGSSVGPHLHVRSSGNVAILPVTTAMRRRYMAARH